MQVRSFLLEHQIKECVDFRHKSVWSVGLLAKSAPYCKLLNEVAKRIASEIAVRGVISFARFMELALYCPVFGYYEKERDTTGRRGDFFTSVSVGSLFGELLAFHFAEWLEELRLADCRLQIVETGAHDGRLGKDILKWLQARRPEVF